MSNAKSNKSAVSKKDAKKTPRSKSGKTPKEAKLTAEKALLDKKRTRLYSHSSDEDGDGDNDRRDAQAKEELEELDKQFFINDDNMDATDGFFNKQAGAKNANK